MVIRSEHTADKYIFVKGNNSEDNALQDPVESMKSKSRSLLFVKIPKIEHALFKKIFFRGAKIRVIGGWWLVLMLNIGDLLLFNIKTYYNENITFAYDFYDNNKFS